jgi:hypothetical protein
MSAYPKTPPGDKTETPFDWRAHIKVHPAAELIPPLSEDQLDELAEDIQKTGLQVPIVSWSSTEGGEEQVLEGRSRLDALARKGLLYETEGHLHLKSWTGTKWAELSGDKIQFQHLVGGDPYALVLSFNIHRRHLTPELKNKLIDDLIKANPEKSNRQIAEQAKVGHPKVANRRKQLEAKGDVEQRSTSIDTKGRRQPAKKPGSKPKTTKVGTVAGIDICLTATEERAADSAENRKAEYAAAADTPPTDTNVLKTEGAKKSAKAVTPEDTALFAFTDRVLDLKRRISNHKPKRFAKTAAKADDLSKLGKFLLYLAELLKAGGAQ